MRILRILAQVPLKTFRIQTEIEVLVSISIESRWFS